MSSYTKPQCMLPSQIKTGVLSKAIVGKKPDGTPSTSLFKVQVTNTAGNFQDVVLQINGCVQSGIGYWDNAQNKFCRDIPNNMSIPLDVTAVNMNIDISSARLYNTSQALSTSAQDYATYQAIHTLQLFNVTAAAPSIYEKMPYLPKGTIEGSVDNFINSCIIGEPLVLPDGTAVDPYRIDEKSGRQYVKSLSVAIALYLKPRDGGKPFEVDNATLWEIVGWETLANGGRKPVLEASKDWLGLLRWGAVGIVKGKFTATSITKDNKSSMKLVGQEFYFERSTRGTGGNLETDPSMAAASMEWS